MKYYSLEELQTMGREQADKLQAASIKIQSASRDMYEAGLKENAYALHLTDSMLVKVQSYEEFCARLDRIMFEDEQQQAVRDSLDSFYS